jgi:hypothetical protein
VSHPAGLPDLFLDRNLGRIQVPTLLRAAGLRLTTLAEYYGVPLDEAVSDQQWLTDATREGWVALMKDTRIRYVPVERETVKAAGARCFCLTSGNLSARAMAGRFIDNVAAIARACEDPGPFIYAVHATKIERLPIGGE